MGEKNTSEYRSIFKATGVFGGVQICSILFSIIKSKIVAIWLGTTGFGIISIFNSSTSLISSLSNLGLQSSSVRDIAAAAASSDKEALSHKVSLTKKLAIITSVLGALITIVLSPILSNSFFKSFDYTVPFIFLSLVILFTGLSHQNNAVLQGTRSIRYLANSTLLSSLLGLLCSIPLFFFLREKGIVFSLILTAVFAYLCSSRFVRKLSITVNRLSLTDTVREGWPIVKLGIFIALSNNVAYLIQFLLKAYISNKGGVGDIGLFQAGWSLNAQYVGLIFMAMSKDYYPRLCQCVGDNKAMERKVIEQSEIGLLLLAPMIALMISFISPVIILLYSKEFLSITSMTTLLLVGTIVQVASWGIGYVFLAKNDGRVYFFNEVLTKLIMLPLYILGYSLYGLEGLGYSFILNQVIYFIWVAVAAKVRYGITYSKGFFFLFFSVIIATILFVFLKNRMGIVLSVIYIIAICVISFIELDKRLQLRQLLQGFFLSLKK